MPAGTNVIEVHAGRLRLRCVVCCTTAAAPLEGRLRGTAQLCRFGCYVVMDGIGWNAWKQELILLPGGDPLELERHKMKCFAAS